jgi:hypothetical protein
LIEGETATLEFILSEGSTNFSATDVIVVGGYLSNFTGSGNYYSAKFKPNTTYSAILVPSGVFTNAAGYLNDDGSDLNNFVSFIFDNTPPTIALTANKARLKVGESALITFTLSEVSTNFTPSNVIVVNGWLSNFNGSAASYTATFTSEAYSNGISTITVASGAFTDSAGNQNSDGSDADNTLHFTGVQVFNTEFHRISVIVDKNVFGQSPMLLKDLKETIIYTDGIKTKHTIEFEGISYNYSDIDSVITTVTRDSEFTEEFTKEINDYLRPENNITYSYAVSLVGVSNIDSVILSVAGADGNFVG